MGKWCYPATFTASEMEGQDSNQASSTLATSLCQPSCVNLLVASARYHWVGVLSGCLCPYGACTQVPRLAPAMEAPERWAKGLGLQGQGCVP